MKINDIITNRIYKWIMIYPWFRKIVVWMYSEVMKLPQYHIDLSPGDIGSYVLLVENPGDVPRVASYLDQAKEVANHREYLSYTGQLKDATVTITSTGIGGPSTAIAIEELSVIGAETFIFLGSSQTGSDSFIIATSAVRDEGTGLQYSPLAFPALADVQVAAALQQVCQARGVMARVGVVHSRDSYYRRGYASGTPQDSSRDDTYPGVLGFDMNTAATFIVSSVLSKRAGAILADVDQDGMLKTSQIEIAIDTLSLLIANERDKESP
jgi:uridine phosphorylase